MKSAMGIMPSDFMPMSTRTWSAVTLMHPALDDLARSGFLLAELVLVQQVFVVLHGHLVVFRFVRCLSWAWVLLLM